jgi:hypothetical protein
MQKKIFLSYFYLKLTRRHITVHIFSIESTGLKINFVLKFFLQVLFQSAEHLYEKRERSGSGAGSVPLTNGSGSGSERPKNMWIIRVRIWNPTMYATTINFVFEFHLYNKIQGSDPGFPEKF